MWQVAAGAALAGFVQGLAGFAYGLIAIAVWAWAVPPQAIGPMVVFGGLIGQVLALPTMRRGFDLRRVAPFLAGGALGVPLGVWLLPHIDQHVFKLSVGLLLLVWCPVMLFARSLPTTDVGGRWADGASGFVGGVMGGIAGLMGPAPTLWCALRGWPRDEQRAVFQTFNMAVQAGVLAGYAASGLITRPVLGLCAIVAPAMLLPCLLGIVLYSRCSDALFRRLVLGLLFLTGLVLIVSAF